MKSQRSILGEVTGFPESRTDEISKFNIFRSGAGGR